MNASLPKVVITDFINDSLAIEKNVLDGIATVEAFDAFNEQSLHGQIESARAVMLYHNLSLSEATISRLTNCDLIVRCGVGFDNVDHRYARQRGIPVANVPDYGTEEVADSAIGMALSLTRGIHFYNQRMRSQPDPWMYNVSQPLYRHRGRVFGIVGLGRIGTATARRALAMGMKVRFYDPLKPDGYDKANGVERVESLQELMKESFILSMHCPLNEDSQHLINSETLKWLPRGSYLVNTARGDVVDTTAIPEALASGQLAGAAIDVLAEEPPRENHPLLAAWRDPEHPAFERLIINPHSAFYCEEGLQDMRRKGAEACRRALTGERLRNVIN
ncbi:C-terminal binding protein [Rhodopirellula sp.]|nr:C-terminal binding protein [Rhodopirellula sp.]MDB4678991.1 C-terminal binding protein [Rhodopirellula sp.]